LVDFNEIGFQLSVPALLVVLYNKDYYKSKWGNYVGEYYRAIRVVLYDKNLLLK